MALEERGEFTWNILNRINTVLQDRRMVYKSFIGCRRDALKVFYIMALPVGLYCLVYIIRRTCIALCWSSIQYFKEVKGPLRIPAHTQIPFCKQAPNAPHPHVGAEGNFLKGESSYLFLKKQIFFICKIF